jgi:hypothetical protein
MLLLAFVALFGAQQAHAQSRTPIPTETPGPTPTPVAITIEEYSTRLATIEATLNNSVNPGRLTPFMAEQLDQIEAIILTSGETIAPENLLEGVSDGQRALALIETTRAQINLAQNDNLAERQEIVAAAVARTNYRGGFSLWAWLQEMWLRLLNWLFGGEDPFANPTAESITREGMRALIRIITIVGAVVIALLLGWWIQRLVRSFVRDADLRRRKDGDGELPATAAEARNIAAEQARSGSYRAAVRSLYLSALLSLEEADLVIHDRTLTNRELLARAGSASQGAAIQPALRPVVQGFDDVWYGEVEPDAAAYATYESDIARLNEQIGIARPTDAAGDTSRMGEPGKKAEDAP